MAKRAPTLCFIAALALASGCAPNAGPQATPPGPLATQPAAPGASPSVSSVPGSGAVAQVPVDSEATPLPANSGVEDAGEEPEALPQDSYDQGDVPPNEGPAYQQALADDGTQAYFPGDLIHDGGVILYRLQQMGLGLAPLSSPMVAGAASGKPSDGMATRTNQQGARPLDDKPCLSLDDLPQQWQRANFLPGGRDVRLRRQGQGMVVATVVATNRGALRFRLPLRPKLQEKRYNERFKRELLFELKGSKAKLIAVGPIELESQKGRGRLNFASITVRSTPGGPLLASLGAKTGDFVPVDQLPAVASKSSLLVEVKLGDGQGCPPYLFAHFLSQGGARDRVPLQDQGISGDATPNDGIYSAFVPVLGPAGLAHLGVEALAPSSFATRSPYQALAVGISFRIQP